MERLIGSVIRGALGGRPKRSRGAARFLTGRRSPFFDAGTLMTLAGVAWGLVETATQPQPSAPPPGSGPGPSSPVVPPPIPGQAPAAGGPLTPPPLPHTASGPAGPPPPPLRQTGGAPAGGSAPPAGDAVPPEVLRVIRLTLSAARADGTLTPHEREAILAQARKAGAEALVTSELDAPLPLEAVVAGVSDPRAAESLYTIAFAIVRADEQVLPGERAYLDALARHLSLDADAVARLEHQAASRIAAASQGDDD